MGTTRLVRRVMAVVLLLFPVFVSPVAVRAQGDPVPAYARALRMFNPQLDMQQSMRLAQCVLSEADAQGLDARLLVALIAIESSWHPEAVSSAGANGLGQLMPATASELGVDAADPRANIHGAALYLRALLNRYARYEPPQRYTLALAAYNAGAGAVARYGGVPPFPETQRYVIAVLRLWRRLAGQE
ncbi:MAG TPA: lytic transglycosylase domain-containing protein [Candidatus Baltobacteraceae bacterium]|nr:lytic transglycosylase domain-containing protein [Candidatus Baltobacteraceae bacterium]